MVRKNRKRYPRRHRYQVPDEERKKLPKLKWYPPNYQIPPKERAELARALQAHHEAGVTLQQLADETGRGLSTVHNYVTQDPESIGEKPKKIPPGSITSPEKKGLREELRKKYEAGASLRLLHISYGLSHTTIRRGLRMEGTVMRPPNEARKVEEGGGEGVKRPSEQEKTGKTERLVE